MKEPLVPYRANSELISIGDAKSILENRLSPHSDRAEEVLTDAFKAKKVKAIAQKGQDMYELPLVFWEVGHNSSFSVGAFNAFWHGIVDNMVDKDRIVDLHTIQGWAVVVEDSSFTSWLDTDIRPFVEKKTLDAFNAEAYWNVMQTLGWIMLRDTDFVVHSSNKNTNFGTHWEECVLPSGKRMVEIQNPRPGLMRLYIEEAYSGIKGASIMMYSDAKKELVAKLQSGDLRAIGRKNNEGDPVEMSAVNWKDADFFEKGESIYVADEDHVVGIGRTQWYDVSFKKKDILNLWPSTADIPIDNAGTIQVAEEPKLKRVSKNDLRSYFKTLRESGHTPTDLDGWKLAARHFKGKATVPKHWAVSVIQEVWPGKLPGRKLPEEA